MSASRLTRWINRYEGPLRVLAATLVLAVLAGLVATSVVLVRFYDQVRLTLPDAGALQDIELKVPSVVLSSDGAVIGEIFDEKRYPVKLDETSQDLRNAFVAAEDAQFYAHSGVDYGGMLRAFINYIGGDGPVQGGSTITQQLAKTLLLTREKTLTRKLKDILLALEIERIMDKSDILELYLNTIFLGNQSYGVEAAARNYFGLSAKNLSLGQSALIAGLAPAPSAYAPTTNMAAAKKRQRYVLTQMVRWGMISAAQADEALAEDIKVSRAKSPNTRVAPYFLEEVKKHLLEVFDQKTLESGGLKVYTTLHHGLQRTADDLVRKYLAQFGDRRGFKGRIASHGSDNVAAIRSLLSEPQPEQEFDVVRAIVVDLNPALDIALIVTQAGLGLVLAEDHKWALSASRSRQSRVLDLANILSIGDEVRVRQLKRGTPRRIQQGARQLSALNAHLEHYPSGPMH
jgi:penicillin-binding protein 1A